jgi:methylenetetrahydrofolate reductase (NADPH)
LGYSDTDRITTLQ